MIFWLYMLICTLLMPICCIYYGNIFMKNPPEMNAAKGYRTTRSMNSNEAWLYAHKLLGKIWRILGVVLLVLSFVGMLYVRNGVIGTIAMYGVIIVVLQIVVLLCSAVPVEMGLKKRF